MNISLIITLFIAACVIVLWAGVYFANRKIKTGQVNREPKPDTVTQILVEEVNDTIPPKNSAVIKIPPELQKRVVNVRTGSKTPQLNRKTKRK